MRRTTPLDARLIAFGALFLSFASCSRRESAGVNEPVILESSGWRLRGEWREQAGKDPAPAVLLLHRAAGSRAEYARLAEALAMRGVASLRLDLRGHGESDNLGRFEAPYADNLRVLEGTHEDVLVALRWIAAHPGVDSSRLAAVGASYSGEAIGEALRESGESVAAHVMLSPGSFSAESVALVNSSGAPWLFIRTSEESEDSVEFIDAVFGALGRDAESAELLVIPGSGHATGIFDAHPFVIEQVADWIAQRLDAS